MPPTPPNAAKTTDAANATRSAAAEAISCASISIRCIATMFGAMLPIVT